MNIRYWAVEGLAFLGTESVIEPLLQVFHDDPSPMIRERAACSLAQSGMLNENQRWQAVPRLLEYAGDPSLDAQTRSWVFQTLRDITGESLPARCRSTARVARAPAMVSAGPSSDRVAGGRIEPFDSFATHPDSCPRSNLFPTAPVKPSGLYR